MPENYHHYHSPVAGTVVEARDTVGNKLFGLEDLIDMVNQGNPGYNRDFSVFEDFKHGYLVIQTEKMGKVAMVPVGLQTVGSVVFRDKFKAVNTDQPVAINKGEAVGHFAYGGSTVLLILRKESSMPCQLNKASRLVSRGTEIFSCWCSRSFNNQRTASV